MYLWGTIVADTFFKQHSEVYHGTHNLSFYTTSTAIFHAPHDTV